MARSLGDSRSFWRRVSTGGGSVLGVVDDDDNLCVRIVAVVDIDVELELDAATRSRKA